MYPESKLVTLTNPPNMLPHTLTKSTHHIDEFLVGCPVDKLSSATILRLQYLHPLTTTLKKHIPSPFSQ
ncbi:hypothetical protein Fmac_026243 [Flemingia macrophylla]|uniref:Uncharacterized protein n=1 Tax=Flemingia macrophylla TaxID=520843 RepID=A0ABD1LEB6_9FABA